MPQFGTTSAPNMRESDWNDAIALRDHKQTSDWRRFQPPGVRHRQPERPQYLDKLNPQNVDIIPGVNFIISVILPVCSRAASLPRRGIPTAESPSRRRIIRFSPSFFIFMYGTSTNPCSRFHAGSSLPCRLEAFHAGSKVFHAG